MAKISPSMAPISEVSIEEIANAVSENVTTKGVSTIPVPPPVPLPPPAPAVSTGFPTETGKTVIAYPGGGTKAQGDTTVNSEWPAIVLNFPGNGTTTAPGALTEQEKVKRMIWIGGGLMAAMLILLVALRFNR